MPYLWFNSSTQSYRKPLKRPILAGSSDSNGIVLTDPAAGRHTFKVACDTGGWFIEDLLECESVLVNGVPILRRYLENGDEICVGDDSITFHSEELPPFALGQYVDGVFPIEEDEIPPIGTYMERKLINLAYRHKKRVKRLIQLSITGFIIALGIFLYGYFQQPVEIDEPKTNFQQVFADVTKLESNGKLEDALNFSVALLNSGNYPQKEQFLRDRIKKIREKISSSAIDFVAGEKNLIRAGAKYPFCPVLIGKLKADLSATAINLFEPAQDVRRLWIEALESASKLTREGEYYSAAQVFRWFIEENPNAVQAREANLRAERLEYRWKKRLEEPYSSEGLQSRIAFDFSKSSAILGWESQEGEWSIEGNKLVLKETDMQGGILIQSSSQYMGSSYWMKASFDVPEKGSASMGLWKGLTEFFAVNVSGKETVVSWNLWGEKREMAFPAAQKGVASVEIAMFRENILIMIAGEVKTIYLPKASNLLGYPFLGGTDEGVSFRNVEYGQ